MIPCGLIVLYLYRAFYRIPGRSKGSHCLVIMYSLDLSTRERSMGSLVGSIGSPVVL